VRLAVISPFLDRSHGTERCVAEQLERLGSKGNELHLYAQRVQDLRGVVRYDSRKTAGGNTAAGGGGIFWHKVPSIAGPHLLQFVFWYFVNQFCRARDAKRHELKYDLVYSPGINAADADAIAVHIVFHEFYEQVRPKLSFAANGMGSWPRLVHRRLYYQLIMALEKQIYANPKVSLAAVSGQVAEQLKRRFQCKDVRIIRHGVDGKVFSTLRRLERRAEARSKFGLDDADFVLLLIGNDWRTKGLDCLLRALGRSRETRLKLLVVGNDARGKYQELVGAGQLTDRVIFLPPSPDVMQFYSAADAYAGPSLEDAYGLPILEAMSCGLPVIASSRAGASEVIKDGENGLILRDPQDDGELAEAISSLSTNATFCEELGRRAAVTAEEHSWVRNAEATGAWLETVAWKKRVGGGAK
jgi:glycosyltransferase involved in cell wall biosynthesis